jgi:hypothetical protein
VTTIPTTEWREYLTGMIHDMREHGALTDPRWIDAFHAVPRHVFTASSPPTSCTPTKASPTTTPPQRGTLGCRASTKTIPWSPPQPMTRTRASTCPPVPRPDPA